MAKGKIQAGDVNSIIYSVQLQLLNKQVMKEGIKVLAAFEKAIDKITQKSSASAKEINLIHLRQSKEYENLKNQFIKIEREKQKESRKIRDQEIKDQSKFDAERTTRTEKYTSHIKKLNREIAIEKSKIRAKEIARRKKDVDKEIAWDIKKTAIVKKLMAEEVAVREAAYARNRAALIKWQMAEIHAQQKVKKAVVSTEKRRRLEIEKSKARMQNFVRYVQNWALRLGIFMSAGLAIRGLKELIIGTIDAARQMDQMAKITGFSTEALSGLDIAAKTFLITSEQLQRSLAYMGRSISLFGRGTPDQLWAFGRLGITFQQLKDLKPEDQLKLISKRFSEIRVQQDRVNIATALFERSGRELIPIVQALGENWDQFANQAKDTGAFFEGKFVKSAVEAGKNIELLKKHFQGFGIYLSTTLIPMMNTMFEAVFRDMRNLHEHAAVQSKKAVGDYVEEIKGNVQGVLKNTKDLLIDYTNFVSKYAPNFLPFFDIMPDKIKQKEFNVEGEKFLDFWKEQIRLAKESGRITEDVAAKYTSTLSNKYSTYKGFADMVINKDSEIQKILNQPGWVLGGKEVVEGGLEDTILGVSSALEMQQGIMFDFFSSGEEFVSRYGSMTDAVNDFRESMSQRGKGKKGKEKGKDGSSDIFEELSSEASDTEKKIKKATQGMEQSFANFFGNVIKDAKNFEDYWKGFLKSILDAFIDMLAKMMAKKMMAAAAGILLNVLSGGIGGPAASMAGATTTGGVPISPSMTPYRKGGSVAGDGRKKELPKFDTGGYFTGSGNRGFPAMLHPREYVIPEPYLGKFFNKIFSSGNFPSASNVTNNNNSSTSNYTPNINVYVQTLDMNSDIDIKNLSRKISDAQEDDMRRRGVYDAIR